MRVISSRKGFSLVELLTVIAIIAILASIIFPVMAMVSNKARLNKCVTQLHQIGLSLQVFKQDNRRYPDILATTVQHQGGPGGAVIPFNRAGQNPDPAAPMGLFPEYVRSSLLFHCPTSKETDPAKAVTDGASGVEFYAYDSYDFMIMPDDSIRQHYARGWAVAGSGTAPEDAVRGVIPDDGATPPRTGDAASDYERQLKFRTPPDNTVVTWCSYHENSSGGSYSGKAPVLFLDGHVDKIDAQPVEDFRYRVLPRVE